MFLFLFGVEGFIFVLIISFLRGGERKGGGWEGGGGKRERGGGRDFRVYKVDFKQ